MKILYNQETSFGKSNQLDTLLKNFKKIQGGLTHIEQKSVQKPYYEHIQHCFGSKWQ